MAGTASYNCRQLSAPQFTRALDEEVRWPIGKQLIVEVKLTNADKVEWYLDERLLTSCEECFRDGRLLEGGGDGVQIFDNLSDDHEGFSRLALPTALQQSSDRAFLRVCATNEFDHVESVGQIRLVSQLATEVPTTAKSSRTTGRTSGSWIGSANDQQKQRRMDNNGKAGKLPGENQPNACSSTNVFDERYEVLDHGIAFYPSPLAAAAAKANNNRRTSARNGKQENECVHCSKTCKSPLGLSNHLITHNICGKCNYEAESLEALKAHKQDEHGARKSLPANIHKNKKKALERRESVKPKTLRELFEQFKGQQMDKNEKFEQADQKLDNKIDDLLRRLDRANLGGEQMVDKTEENEDFLSEDDAKD